MPLEEIQARLYGKSDRELEAILESISNKRNRQPAAEINPLVWREIIIEPGLKIMAEAKWQLSDEEALAKRIRALVGCICEGGKTMT